MAEAGPSGSGVSGDASERFLYVSAGQENKEKVQEFRSQLKGIGTAEVPHFPKWFEIREAIVLGRKNVGWGINIGCIDSVKQLLYLLNANPCLTDDLWYLKLNLDGKRPASIEDETLLDAMWHRLAASNRITSIELGLPHADPGFWLGEKHCHELACIMRRSALFLRYVDISGPNDHDMSFGSQGLGKVIAGLRGLVNLDSLFLYKIPIEIVHYAEGKKRLTDALHSLSEKSPDTLRHVHFEMCELGEGFFNDLVRALVNFTNLEVLFVRDNMLDDSNLDSIEWLGTSCEKLNMCEFDSEINTATEERRLKLAMVCDMWMRTRARHVGMPESSSKRSCVDEEYYFGTSSESDDERSSESAYDVAARLEEKEVRETSLQSVQREEPRTRLDEE